MEKSGSRRGFLARAYDALGLLINVERRSNYTIPTALNNWLGLGGATKAGPRVDIDTALGVSTVYACTGIISGAIARLPLKLYRKTARGREEVTDHPAGSLIATSPDGVRTAFAWRQMMEASVLLRGNAYSRIVRDKYHDVVALEWLNPNDVVLRVGKDTGMPFYWVRNEPVPADEIFHHREMSLDGVTGLSPVTMMREQIALSIATQECGARFFSNGAMPSLVLSAAQGTTPAQMKAIRDDIITAHTGVSNLNKPLIVNGLQPTTVSLSNTDSQFLESRKFDIEEIARAYRVPLFLLQSTEKATSWGTGIEQLSRGFVDYSLADRMERWEQELDLALLTKAERSGDQPLYFKFNLKALLSGSNADRAAFYTAMRVLGAMSINEIRAAEELNNLPDHIGDNYAQPMNGSASAAAQAGGKPLPTAANAA